MITAFISQARGLAVFDDGERMGVLLDEDAEPLERTEAELSRFLRGADDVETLRVATVSQLRSALRHRRMREEALHAALLVIDGESSMGLRRSAASRWLRSLGLRPPMERTRPSTHAGPAWTQAMEAREPADSGTPWSRGSAIGRWVEGVLMSVPAPPTADFDGARNLVPGVGGEIFDRVAQHQPRIRAVHAAFVAAGRRLGTAERPTLRAQAVREGWFRALVLHEGTVASGSSRSPRVRAFVEAWASMCAAQPA